MTELTNQQIVRQDFVDNKIFELINELLPPSKKVEWDIAIISTVRESIRQEIVDELKIMNESEFYPFIK